MVQNGHVDTCQRLVEAGATIDAARLGGFTPLYIACQHGHDDVVLYLLTGRRPALSILDQMAGAGMLPHGNVGGGGDASAFEDNL